MPTWLDNWRVRRAERAVDRLVHLQTKVSKVGDIVVTSGGTAIYPMARNNIDGNVYQKYADEAYMKNVIAFRCILDTAEAVASVPWALYRWTSREDNESERVFDHPIANVLDHANPLESWSMLMLRSTAYGGLDGNSYWERVGPLTGDRAGTVQEMYVHRPDRIHIVPDERTGRPLKYVYETAKGKREWRVDPITMKSDMLHLKLFHPTDDWYGAAITESVAREIDTSNASTDWNMNLIQNYGRPGMIVAIGGARLKQKEKEEFERKLSERHSGPANAGKSAVLQNVGPGTTITPYGWSPSEMDWIEGHREVARRIAYGYGVPPMLLGIPGDNTYSNMKEARLGWWETSILWWLRFHRWQQNNWLFEREDAEYIDFEPFLKDVPAMQPRIDAQYERQERARDILTVDERREIIGYPKYEINDDDGPGDVIMVDATKLPLGSELQEPSEEDEKKLRKQLTDTGYSEGDADVLLDAYADDDDGSNGRVNEQ